MDFSPSNLEELRAAAAGGEPQAQTELGILYSEGKGLAQDLGAAATWYRLAAEQGDNEAQFRLGCCYKHGQGITKDPAEAVKWFQLAAEQDLADAQLLLSLAYGAGEGVSKDQEESLKWLRRAAEGGRGDAQTLLGIDYMIGTRLSRDPSEAVRWFQRGADSNHAGAQASLGHCLAFGIGVTRDPTAAILWIKKAAEQGDSYGQNLLGYAYSEGIGLPKDFALARKWLGLAAEYEEDAKYRLRLLWFEEHPILKWRYAFMSVAGYALLFTHALRVPFTLNLFAIEGFLLILLGFGVLFVAALAILEKMGLIKPENDEFGTMNARFLATLKQKPWLLLTIPAEDGFFLLPLLYIGINPWAAAIAAILFGAFHYPSFPWRYCAPKGVAYFFVALFILPYGIWSVIAAHLMIDLSVFGLLLLGDLKHNPAFQRMFRALRTR